MPEYLYVSLRGGNIIARYRIGGGVPEDRLDIPAPGGPGPMALHPSGRVLFAGLRDDNKLAALRVLEGGRLAPICQAALPGDPCFLSTAEGGRFVLSAYYGAGQLAVHEWHEGVGRLEERQRVLTQPMAHSIRVLPGSRHVIAPHTGPNRIYRYALDPASGRLDALEPPWLEPARGLQPRHACFHAALPLAYVANEGSCTVSVYVYDRQTGELTHLQTVSTLPGRMAPKPGFLAAEVRLSPDCLRLYASNRGHDSIAWFAVGASDGLLAFKGTVPTARMPRSFDLSPDGARLYAAGEASGELAVYDVSGGTGPPEELCRIHAGERPLWVMAARLPA